MKEIQRFWLDSYPDGTPHDIDIGTRQSIIEFLRESCQRVPNEAAFSNFKTSLSFAQIDQLSLNFAAYLQHELKLSKGDRIAIMLPNLLQYPIALFGALRLGLMVVNIDPMYTRRELTHQLNDSGATTLVFLENFAQTVEATIPDTQVQHLVCTSVGEMLQGAEGKVIDFVLRYVKRMVPKHGLKQAPRFKQALTKGEQHSCTEATITLDDIAFLQYTGGTTGVSKGAILTHGNIIANVLQAKAWIGDTLTEDQEKAITALPLYHIFSLTANMLLMTSIGNENILITNPRDFEGFVKFLKKTEFTVFIGVNTLFRKLLNTKGFNDIDFSNLNLSFAGGMAVTDDVARDWLTATNSVVVEAYGLTETSPAVCVNPLGVKEFTGSIGLPISSTYVQMKDDQGKDVGINKEGELCVKGPQVTQGYWQLPEVNEEAFTKDGYFRTGDFAQIDEHGYVKLLDRKKDMILVSGFNVFPNEIENVVSQHPKVLEAAAIGIPDDISGEVVKLFVVKEDSTLSVDEVKAYCRENLTGYKRPKEIVFMDEELPKTNVGKISRKDLRDD